MLYLLFLFFYLPTTDDSDNAGDTVATENVPTLPAMVVVVVVATRWAFVVKSTDKFSSRGVLLLPWMSLRIHEVVVVVFVFP